jgi:hypothetical protein
MNKTDLLFQMLEQPHRYTAEEWQEILADDECRELYTLMSKTQSAVDAACADEKITDDMIEEEWKSFKIEELKRKDFNPTILQSFNSMRKFAAMIVGILMLSGIAYAAIHIVRHTTKVEVNLNSPTEDTRYIKSHPQIVENDTTTTPQQKLYDNVPLEQILSELSTYYHIKIRYSNEAARKIRLFYQWKPDYSKEKIVEMLNNFEWLQLELENDSLFVSSTVEPQP